MKKQLIFDIECYVNYFLVMFENEAGKVVYWEMHNDERPDISKLQTILSRYTLVGFNSNGYDIPMLSAFVGGKTNAQLKTISDHLVTYRGASWKYGRKYNVKPLTPDTIDLIEVAPGMASLKIYGGRLHAPKLQDLPIAPSAVISLDQAAELRRYCRNDLETTRLLAESLSKQIDLRVKMSAKYNLDLRSKSDAQIAEAVLKSELESKGVDVYRPDIAAGTAYKYRIPPFIQFEHPELVCVLNDIGDSLFVVADSGSVLMPDALKNRKIPIGEASYRMGIGGLHSSEKKQAVYSDDDCELFEIDVTSYYPNIILGDSLYPRHLGEGFLDVYGDIVGTRLAAKASGDKVTADSLKITINGSFGKLGSKYSTLYSPDLLIQVTITGQLSLLMLIERIEAIGVKVVSANTDGIVVKCPKHLKCEVEDIVMDWEFSTGYEMEYTYYSALYSRDVNNYIAVKTDGSAKGKGAFASAGLMKNPNNLICVDAVIKYLTLGQPVADTVMGCSDITQFVTIRTVKGGAVKDGVELGKAVRWYYGKGVEGSIHYLSNNNRVPKSEGAKPCMQLPDEFPGDVNHQWYIDEGNQMLIDLGVTDARIEGGTQRGDARGTIGLFEL